MSWFLCWFLALDFGLVLGVGVGFGFGLCLDLFCFGALWLLCVAVL